jgi:LCP family protein required for cell wall assembly
MIKNRKLKVVAVILACVALIAAGGSGYVYYQLSKVKYVDIPKTDEELGINKADNAEIADSETPAAANNSVGDEQSVVTADNSQQETVNIALFGVDQRYEGENGRSDSITILSIDYKNKKLKLSSIMRDTYVYIEGHGMTKLNHAYSYGGPTLAIKTLNSNFNLSIKEFVTVDFDGFKNIIDSFGGIEMEIKSYELPSMNSVGIYSAGAYTLNGTQALAYARIRHQGDGDYERTDRQRRVLEQVFQKIEDAGVSKFPAIVSSLIPYTETSLDADQILSLRTSVFSCDITTMEQKRFPLDDYSEDKIINSIWYLVTDLDATTSQIHEFIYEDQGTVQ